MAEQKIDPAIAAAALAANAAATQRQRSVMKVGEITAPAWCVVHCNAGQERLAAASIIGRGLMAYDPRFIEERRINAYSQRTREIERPLFPGYIFAAYQAETDDWKILFGRPGVRRVVTNNDRPMLVAPAFMDELRGHEAERAVPMPDPARTFEAGEGVRISRGPFASFYAKLISIDSEARITALVEMFGRQTPIQVTIDDIEKI